MNGINERQINICSIFVHKIVVKKIKKKLLLIQF